MLEDAETRLAVHEALCSERYKRIYESLSTGERRMAKIEYLLYAVILVVLLGPGVAAEFVKKLIGV
jgi:predicted nucleic acid-binding Zn ribbon protein